MQGWELIKEERERQIGEEGWSGVNDDKHTKGQLSQAAVTYTGRAVTFSMFEDRDDYLKKMLDEYDSTVVKTIWPWHLSWYKPSPSRVRNLVKAGALIAAEIDRLNRLESKNE